MADGPETDRPSDDESDVAKLAALVDVNRQ